MLPGGQKYGRSPSRKKRRKETQKKRREEDFIISLLLSLSNDGENKKVAVRARHLITFRGKSHFIRFHPIKITYKGNEFRYKRPLIYPIFSSSSSSSSQHSPLHSLYNCARLASRDLFLSVGKGQTLTRVSLKQ